MFKRCLDGFRLLLSLRVKVAEDSLPLLKAESSFVIFWLAVSKMTFLGPEVFANGFESREFSWEKRLVWFFSVLMFTLLTLSWLCLLLIDSSSVSNLRS